MASQCAHGVARARPSVAEVENSVAFAAPLVSVSVVTDFDPCVLRVAHTGARLLSLRCAAPLVSVSVFTAFDPCVLRVAHTGALGIVCEFLVRYGTDIVILSPPFGGSSSDLADPPQIFGSSGVSYVHRQIGSLPGVCLVIPSAPLGCPCSPAAMAA